MKLSLAATLLAITGVSAGKQIKRKSLAKTQIKDIKATSKLGQDLLSKARKLNDQQQDEEFEPLWVADYSLKFQGCHHISQWNEEADGEEDVRVQTKRLVRFRLCPSDSCTTDSAAGCTSQYGEYVIDMNTYLEAYMESVQAYWEYECEKLVDENGDCACENANDDEKCQYDCFVEKGVEEYCADNNPYEDDEAADIEFELENYMMCANYDFPDDGRRKLAEEDEIEYFVGPYCAKQGGAIHLGLFTDDTCTTFADDYGGAEVFKNGAGIDLPYANENLVNMDCISCMEPKEDDENNDGNDAEDEDEVREVCEQLYMSSGKCEEALAGIISSAGGSANNNACNYMEGIKVIRMDGTVSSGGMSGANKTASIFIGVFAVAFILLASYTYYLKTKLDRASINLAE